MLNNININNNILDDPVEYKIVATPTFLFQGNYFPQFSLAVLDLPGGQNVPLGSLTIGGNKVPCDCRSIQVVIIIIIYLIVTDNNAGTSSHG